MSKWLIILCLMASAHLSAETKVLAFAGSTRQDSLNKRLVRVAADQARQMGAQVKIIDLKDYMAPFYDADFEAKEGMPSRARQLRQLMIQSDVILIASPEYNNSIPAVLKNALDWASRSEEGKPSRDAFKGKKFVILSTSPGKGGGARGLVHLRAIIEDIGGTVIPEQVIVPNGNDAFDEQGQLKNPEVRKELQQAIQQALKGR